MTGVNADLVDPPLVPGSDQWRAEITASKVSAILGLSPWTSQFAIWHDMAGYIPHEDGEMTVNQARGHWLEDAIAQWFASEFSVHLRPGKCWRSREHPWMVVTPDRLVFPHRYSRTPTAVVEVKTAGGDKGWGPDGSDEIPPYYRAQIVFQLDALGLEVGYLAALLPRLAFRAYPVRHDRDEAEWIRDQVTHFVSTLPGQPNEQVPDIDESDSTYRALQKMHPLIEDRDVPVTVEFAREFLTNVQAEKDAKATAQESKSKMAHMLGDAKRAVLVREGQDPLVIAMRQPNGKNPPYVKAPQNPPTWEDLIA